MNRNKRSVTLDIAKPEGQAIALDLIAQHGGGVVEGYPEAASAVPVGFLFNGALSTFEAMGFKRERPIGKHRWVVGRTV